MRNSVHQLAAIFSGVLSTLFILSGCGGSPARSTEPEKQQESVKVTAPVIQVTQFKCAGGRLFQVSFSDDGTLAWVSAGGMSYKLKKITSIASSRYINGSAVLDIKGVDATFASGSASAFTECKLLG